jgi:hypothetical protein|tara:strand:- start:463 stop:654 length:192 start_codon:yes stop_codon:yes gene_type:complete
MSEQPTNEQIIVNDLVNQLQEKETAIIGYRVTITQLKAQIAGLQVKEEAVETVEDKKKKESKD